MDYKKGAHLQELSIIEAQLAQTLANAKIAASQLNRNTQLYHANALSKEDFDS